MTTTATVTVLGDLSSIYGSSFAAAINNAGQVVGWSLDDSGIQTAFLWQNGAMTSLDVTGEATNISSAGQAVGYEFASEGFVPGFKSLNGTTSLVPGYFTLVFGTNSAGSVAGWNLDVTSSGDSVHAAIVENGNFVDLGTLSTVPADSGAAGINDAGQVVGWSQVQVTSGYQLNGFIWQNGTMSNLGTLGGGTYDNSEATAINTAGQVVGWSTNETNSGKAIDAFVWQNGTMSSLGTLGGGTSEATAIDSTGQVVGWSITSNGAEHAFLWQNGTMIDLNALLAANSGWTLVEATGINDSGQVVGEGLHNGADAAFVLQLPTVLPTVSYSVAPSSPIVTESAGAESFAITRSSDSAAATVYVSTEDNSTNTTYATNGGVFSALADQSVSFAIGQSTAQVTLTINDISAAAAADKTFGVEVTDGPSSTAHILASGNFSIVTAVPAANTGYSISSAALSAGSSFLSSETQINNSGDAGWVETNASNVEQILVYTNGSFTTISAPAGTTTISVAGIDDSGQVAGTLYADSGTLTSNGFLYSGGSFTTISPSGATSSSTESISSAGLVTELVDQSGSFGVEFYQNGTLTQGPSIGVSNIGNGEGQLAWGGGGSGSALAYGYVYSQGSTSTYSISQYYDSLEVDAISTNGEVAAFSYCPLIGANSTLGYIFNGGNVITYDFPGGATIPSGGESAFINNSGQVAGYYYNSVGYQMGFIYADGVFSTVDPGGSSGVTVDGLTQSGQVVGTYAVASAQYGYIYKNGSYATIDPAGSSYVTISGINNAGQVAGDYTDANGNTEGFIYSNGTYTEIDPTGAVSTKIASINDIGQVAGTYVDANGLSYAFVASPPTAAPVTVASVIGSYQSGQLLSAIPISDSAINVQDGLDSLQAVAAAALISTITLTDSGTPQLSISATQLTADALVLADISGSYALTVTGVAAATAATVAAELHVTAIAVSDSAADVVANISALETLATSGELTSITLTDTSTPQLDLTAQQIAQDSAVLHDIASAYTLGSTSTETGSAPTLTDPYKIPTYWTAGAPILLNLPSNSFTDPNGSALTYSATLANGSALPSWLVFHPLSDSFSGTLPSTEQGDISLKVTATDSLGLSASETITAIIPGPVVSNSGSSQETLVAPIANSTIEGAGYDVLNLSLNPIASASSAYTLTANTANSDESFTLATTGSSDFVVGVMQVQFANEAITVAVNSSMNEYTALLYQGALGRTPDPQGLAYWEQQAAALPASALSLGAYALSDASSIAAGFVNSTEFQSKYGSLSNTQYVNQLYLNVLDRDADTQGLNYWLSELSSGESRAHVLVGFAESAEAISNATNGFVGNSGTHAAWLFLI